MHCIATVIGAIVFLSCSLSTPADVLYNGEKAIALGKGKEDKDTIHWTYCDGKKGDFKKPPHKFVTGEHCKIGPDAFGIGQADGNYFVSDPEIFRKFFSEAARGDKVTFSADQNSVRMKYKGQIVTLDRSGNQKQFNQNKAPLLE